jgi:hypothetical protein
VPAGYKIMPHTHPTTENVTAISGTFNIGMAEKFDQVAGKELPVGGFASTPAHRAILPGDHRRGRAGAWRRAVPDYYVNAADDPRNAKK